MQCAKLIKQLRNTTGSLAKECFIREHANNELFTKVLYYTYHPMKTYHLSKAVKTDKIGLIHIEDGPVVFNILDMLSKGELSGGNARIAVFNTMQSLTRSSQDIFACIVQKDLRAGVSVTTINKAIPGLIPVFGAMLAKKFTGKVPKDGLYMSLKIDGLRCLYENGTLYTRNGHEIRGADHIIKNLPKHEAFDGEIHVPGSHFQEASGKIRSFNDCPNAVYSLFDLPKVKAPFEDRLVELNQFKDLGPSVSILKHIFTNKKDKIELTMHKAIAAGYEGLVLKTPDHFYEPKRSSGWLKMKLERSKDLPIVGFFEGEGKYQGSLGGIIVQHGNVQVRVGSGFTDMLRRAIWDNQEDYIDVLAEVMYHEETPGGSLRHPRFKRFRRDK